MMIEATEAQAPVRQHDLVVARRIQAIQQVVGGLPKIQTVVGLRRSQARHHPKVEGLQV